MPNSTDKKEKPLWKPDLTQEITDEDRAQLNLVGDYEGGTYSMQVVLGHKVILNEEKVKQETNDDVDKLADELVKECIDNLNRNVRNEEINRELEEFNKKFMKDLENSEKRENKDTDKDEIE